ncbi:MAG: hypothetical protein EPO11_03925 [Gammaproteobacteria bacterium]|nr:MAG: hypothetical protein EPO11_03925 [Gammaproteobacteria bacterium]
MTYPLLINASATIALASFLHNNVATYLKIAFFTFICGILFGLVTLILEYITPYFALEHFKNHFFLKHPTNIDKIKQKHDTYFSNKNNRTKATITIRLCNGAFALICSYIDITCVVNHFAGTRPCYIWLISLLFSIYTITLVFLVKKKLKPDLQPKE